MTLFTFCPPIQLTILLYFKPGPDDLTNDNWIASSGISIIDRFGIENRTCDNFCDVYINFDREETVLNIEQKMFLYKQ